MLVLPAGRGDLVDLDQQLPSDVLVTRREELRLVGLSKSMKFERSACGFFFW